ncbi:hypothetical protein LCGC14_0351220 [marine sediment metagenome]|uniref:GIY-YIG domain-containing protein n=1 Tax=marine sediment metagenome TaxID=412755 RepID=A0A0F9WIL8_9ZZZZ
MGNLTFNYQKTCKRCREDKSLNRFESLPSNRFRLICKDCYNKRRRELHGGVERDNVRRLKKLNGIINKISGCSLLSMYKPDDSSHYRIKLSYCGFEWDLRNSSFIQGNRPWTKYKQPDYVDGSYVYKFLDCKKKVLYVGKSSFVNERMSKHFSPSEIKKGKQYWKSDVAQVLILKCESEADMHFLESYLINKIKPKHNMGSIAKDQLSFNIEIPEFKDMWVEAVYGNVDKTL